MKKITLFVLLFLSLFSGVKVNAERGAYDEAVYQMGNIEVSSDLFTDFEYFIELSYIVIDNYDELNEEELDKIETLMMTLIHNRVEPLYESHFKSIQSTNGSHSEWFNGIVGSGVNPYELLRSNHKTQSAIQSQIGN